MLRLEHISPARDDEQGNRIAHDDERLEVAEVFVSAPVFRELHGGALEIAGEAFELLFESFKEGEGVCSGAGEARENLTLLADAPDFSSVALHHGLAHRDLAVADQHQLPALADSKNGRRMPSRRVAHESPFLTRNDLTPK